MYYRSDSLNYNDILAMLYYEMSYKKTICDKDSSPDEKYQIILMAIGEPDWSFGSASGQLILKEGKKRYLRQILN